MTPAKLTIYVARRLPAFVQKLATYERRRPARHL
jgi:hypothetical protein